MRVEDDGIVLNPTLVFFGTNPDGFSLRLDPISNLTQPRPAASPSGDHPRLR